MPGEPLSLDEIIIKVARHYLTKEYPNEIRACLDALTEEEIWQKPDDFSNSVGHLVLHLVGATRYLVENGVAGVDVPRDREAEFHTEERPPKAELAARLDATLAMVYRVLDAIDEEALRKLSDRTRFHVSNFQLLVGAVAHFAYHTGQIVYATKAIKPGVFAAGDLYLKAAK